MARKIGYAVRPIADIQADLDELGNRLSRVATFIRDKVQRAVVYAEPAGHNNRYLLAQARGETRHAELAVSELIDQADKKIDDIVQDVRILLETSFAESTSQALLAKFFPRAVAFLAGGPRAHYHNLKTRFEHLVAQMTDLEKRLPHFEVTSPEEKPPVAPLRGASSSRVTVKGSHNNVFVQGDGSSQRISIGLQPAQVDRLLEQMVVAVRGDATLTPDRRADAEADINLLHAELGRPVARFERIRAYLTDLGSIASITSFVSQLVAALPR